MLSQSFQFSGNEIPTQCVLNFPSTVKPFLSLSLSHLPLCSEEMYRVAVHSDSGKPHGQFLSNIWRNELRDLPGVEIEDRPCFIVTAVLAMCCTLYLCISFSVPTYRQTSPTYHSISTQEQDKLSIFPFVSAIKSWQRLLCGKKMNGCA